MARIMLALLLVGLTGCSAARSGGGGEAAPVPRGTRFVDGKEAKDPAYHQGCVLSDYRELVEQQTVTWGWVDPAVKVGGPGKIDVRPIRNVSDVTDSAVAPKLQRDFEEALERIGKTPGKGGLTLESCIVWMERFEPSKAFIPFAGGHLMQAGVGVEIAITDPSGRTVAKIRHSVREGTDPSASAGKIADDVANYLRDH